MHTVSISLMPSSRATIAAGTRPPRVMLTIASNGPAPLSRQASARESRWNWSHDTGKIFSGAGIGAFDCCGSGIAIPSLSLPLRKLGFHARQHGFDRRYGGGNFLWLARAHHDVCVAAAFFIHE